MNSSTEASKPVPLPNWLSMQGQVAVVTGGGTHLGLAMAGALAELGAAVVLLEHQIEY